MKIIFDGKISLYIQVKRHLISLISSGEMAPNSKVPSERVLAKEFQISRSTAKQALQELEAENFIERIPAKGSYVCDVLNGKHGNANILFPFPEKLISEKFLEYEDLQADTEIYRGLISAAGKYNAKVTFQHFADSVSKEALRSQVKEVQAFSGAVFVGRQFKDLKNE